MVLVMHHFKQLSSPSPSSIPKFQIQVQSLKSKIQSPKERDSEGVLWQHWLCSSWCSKLLHCFSSALVPWQASLLSGVFQYTISARRNLSLFRLPVSVLSQQPLHAFTPKLCPLIALRECNRGQPLLDPIGIKPIRRISIIYISLNMLNRQYGNFQPIR